MNMMSPTPSSTSVLSSIVATCRKTLHYFATALLAVFLTSSSKPPSNFHIIRVACTAASHKNHRSRCEDGASGRAVALAYLCYSALPRRAVGLGTAAHVVEQGVSRAVDNKQRVDAAGDKHRDACHVIVRLRGGER
jgi:hypothetical protein